MIVLKAAYTVIHTVWKECVCVCVYGVVVLSGRKYVYFKADRQSVKLYTTVLSAIISYLVIKWLLCHVAVAPLHPVINLQLINYDTHIKSSNKKN